MYIHKLNDKVNKYKNIYPNTIKIKPVDVTLGIYTDFKKENHKEDPKFKVSDHVRMQKYRNILHIIKVTFQMVRKKFLWLKKLKRLCPGPMLLMILTVKKLLETFKNI